MPGKFANPERQLRLAAALGAALLLGAGGGAGAMALTRPSIELPPAAPTAIARLGRSNGIVLVQGTTDGVFGDRLLVHDASGRTLVDVGPRMAASARVGAPIKVQGRFVDGQLRARFLIQTDGTVEVAGPPPLPSHGPAVSPPDSHLAERASAPDAQPAHCGPTPVETAAPDPMQRPKTGSPTG